MFWGIVHRKVLGELFKVFAVSLIALTGLILMAGVISEAMKNGLSPGQIVGAIPLMLPGLLPYTVPTTTLFATCIVYGRLSADNEILALKAAGVHILHVVWPALLLGVLTTVATLFLFLDAIPYTSFVLRNQGVSDVEELLYTILRKDGCIRHYKLNYEIHVKQVRGRMLHDVIFKRRSREGKGYDTIARAREAELHVDVERKEIDIVMWQCQLVQGGTVGLFDHQVWPVPVPEMLIANTHKQRACDMTWSELGQYEQEWQEDTEKISRDIDRHQAQINRGRDDQRFREHIEHLNNERRTREGQISSIANEWHMRPALALGCFCFALVGCPIGIWLSKSDYLSAFVTCFLPIVVVYYPVMFLTINAARAGRVPPWLTIYGADVLMLLAGIVLFRKLVRN